MKRGLADRGQGRKPYGYYEGEEAVIERMRWLKAAGMGYDRIAGQLNGEGVKPRAGDRWWGKTVNNILQQAGPQEREKQAEQSTADLMLETILKIEPLPTVPVSIAELRKALPNVDAGEFDRVALALRNERRVFLSRHDFPQAERPETRRLLVREGDRYYVAISIRTY
jgi:hypothetical protein